MYKARAYKGARDMEKATILVNGVVYDAITGMPIKKQANSRASTMPAMRKAKASYQVHQHTMQSHTAVRRTTPPSMIQKRSDTKRVVAPPSTKSHHITKFAPRVMDITPMTRPMNDMRPAPTHPIAKKAEERMHQAHLRHVDVVSPIKPSSVIKNEAISEALSKATAHESKPKTTKPEKRSPKILSFASVALSLLLLAGYMTYINLPNLSVRVAASQAGIEASYPGYRPDGYRLAGVNYEQGSVSLKFAANAGPQNFTITQQQTNWDSTAVKENYVKTNWGDDVVPYSERGLTIYAHEGNAAWVNGGILYTITGDATLSTSQVRGIATSL